MLIYRNDGKLQFISQKALKLAGYSDVAQFLDEHNDYSELFVKKPGYIYNFESFSWLSFLKNANPEQKKVLISTKDKATYECELVLEKIFPVEYEEGTPEFYYQVEFKNLHLSTGKTGEESFGPIDESLLAATAEPEKAEPVVFGETAEPRPSAFGETSPASAFADMQEEEVPTVSFGTETAEEGQPEPEPILFETPEPTPAHPAADQPLELVDFELKESEEKPEKEATAETPSAESEPAFDLDEAFASLKIEEPTPEAAQPVFAEETPPPAAEEPEAAEEAPLPRPETKEDELPDLRKVAATLGLPETMVKAFVKEFVDTYYDDRDEVKVALDSGMTHALKTEAIKLKGISANLMMIPLTRKLEAVLETENAEEAKNLWLGIDAYVERLAAAFAPERVAETPKTRPQAPEHAEEASETPAADQKPAKEEESVEASAAEPEGATFTLEETDTGEPVSFDPAEAANALGLPESLIVEFVNDFIQQAREEKEVFEKAYAEGDLKTVNEVAHKLKGVAANLRIEEMRALMEEAQHAASLEEAEKPLVTFYHKLAGLSKTMAKEYA